jgi:hypothetical protein
MRLLYLCALTAGGVAVAAYWSIQPDPFGVRPAVALGAWLVSLVATGCAARQDQAGLLKYVAGEWTWYSRGLAIRGSVIVMVDLQRMLVVTFTGQDGQRLWFSLQHCSEPAAWAALRRAAVSTAVHNTGGAGHDMPL